MLIGRRAVLAGLAAAGATGRAAAGPARVRTGDLEGLWTLGSYTDFERPKDLASLVLTAAEAEAYEAPRRALGGMRPSTDGEVGQPESEFNERGEHMMRVKGEIRSSWIVDPPDGRIPYTKESVARLGLDTTPPRDNFDGPEARPGNERCLSNAAAGAPMVGGPDTNLVQILQTPDAVVFLTEKYHELRIVRLGPSPARAPPPAWLGESRGRWEGATLVVETQGFRPGVTNRGNRLNVSGATRVVERLTRTAPGEILYAFTVEDPTLFTQPWRAETVLTPAPGRLFEYACHEGNYGLPDILRIARQADAVAAAKAVR